MARACRNGGKLASHRVLSVLIEQQWQEFYDEFNRENRLKSDSNVATNTR